MITVQNKLKELANGIKINRANTCYGTLFYLYEYFPKNRYSDCAIARVSRYFRNFLYQFKDGNNSYVSTFFANTIIWTIDQLIPSFNCSDYAFLAMPASSETRNDRRYGNFLSQIAKRYPNVEILNSHICYKCSRDSFHLTQNRNGDSTRHFTFNADLSGKTVVLFDDISTTGISMNQMGQKLKTLGADKVIYLSIGRTVYNYGSRIA